MPDHPRFPRLLSAMVLTLAATACSNDAIAHQFEDGYIERAVAVRIRDRVGTIVYSVGLNDATMESFRNRWPDDQALREQFLNAQKHLQSNLDGEPKLADTRDDSIEGKDTNLPEEGELVNEIELIRAFAKTAAPHLQAGLLLYANEQPLPLKLVSATPSAKHHATLESVWRFQLPSAPLIRISVRDTNFLLQPGGIKYSMKTSGTSMTVQSNVAPILIRSARISLDNASVKQRMIDLGIRARIRILQPSDAGE